MRMIRSFICAGLAMMAIAVCTTMPAIAAVPIDPGIRAEVSVGRDYPAPMAIVADMALIKAEVPMTTSPTRARSSGAVDRMTFFSSSVAVIAYLHIDPGRTRF